MRSPSAENDYIRIEQIDDPRQRSRQPVFESIQRRQRSGFSGNTSRDDFRPAKRKFCRPLVILFQAGSGDPCFDAAIFFAIAGRPGKFLWARPGQRIVSPFARHAIRTAVYAPIDCDSAAAARSQDYREHHVLACTRAVSRFGNRQAVCVVRTTHFPSERVAEVLIERLSIQPG